MSFTEAIEVIAEYIRANRDQPDIMQATFLVIETHVAAMDAELTASHDSGSATAS
jgi:hypothetical protein